MKTNQEIILVPVLELPPFDFSKEERVSPKKSILEAPQEWVNYNQSCYNDSGLNNIKPINPLSWLFKIEPLSDDELKIILKQLIDNAVEEFDSINEILDDLIEYAPLIPGGYLFEVNQVIKSEPGCCCGLENILNWKDDETVLTGHGDDDFVHITRKNAQVEISIKQEIFILSKEDYDKVVKEAEGKIDKFVEKSGILINNILGIKNGKSFAKAMIYKWD
ncbi:MAG: hypothetical protein AB8G86_25165 [Saprospiraceae bacterium]